MLKLAEHVRIIIFPLYKQKTRWNSDDFEFSEFLPIFRKNPQFSGPACFYDVITT